MPDVISYTNLGLYGFGYVPAICHGYSDLLSSAIYIDSRTARNCKVEEWIQHSINHEYRMSWMPLEVSLGQLSYSTISSALPYAPLSIVFSIARFVKNNGYIPVPQIDELLYMSQRTHLCELRASELLYFASQCYSFFLAYLHCAKLKVIISTEIPHHFTDYILCLACKTLGIPFVSQINQAITHSALFLDFSSSRFLPNTSEYGMNACRAQDLEDFILKYSARGNPLIPRKGLSVYDEGGLDLSSITSSNIRTFLTSGTEKSMSILSRLYDSAKFFDSLAQKRPAPAYVNGTKHYFFAHLQPEATTSPMCGKWVDHRFCLAELSKTIGEDDIILYKEHPNQFRFLPLMDGSDFHISNVYSIKDATYYSSLVSIPNVYLLSRFVSVDEIFMQPNIKIWSPNGTVSLEAFLAGKDVGFFDTLSPWRALYDKYIDEGNGGLSLLVFARNYLQQLSWPMIISDLYLINHDIYSNSLAFRAKALGELVYCIAKCSFSD